MAGHQACIGCNTAVENGKKIKALTVAHPDTIKAVFPGASSPTKDECLCFKCLSFLRSKSMRRGKGRKYHLPPAKKDAPAMLTPGNSPPRKKQTTRSSPSRSPEQLATQSPEQMTTAPPEHSYATQPPEQMDTSPPQHTSPFCARPAAKGSGPLAMAKRYLETRHYYDAFRCFLQSSVSHHMIRACTAAIKKERKNLSRDPDGPFRATTDPKDMASFTWDGALSWAGREAPFLTACLRATFPPPPVKKTKPPQIPKKTVATKKKKTLTAVRGKRKRPLSVAPNTAASTAGPMEKYNRAMVDQRTGMALSMALFTHNNCLNNFIQTCMGIELWKQGCSKKLFRTMNHMGLSLGIKGSKYAVDRLRLGHDDGIKELQEKPEVPTSLRSEEEEVSLTRPIKRRLSLLDGSAPKSSLLDGSAPKSSLLDGSTLKSSGTYSVTWDSVQMRVHGKLKTEGLLALTFGHQNKVNFSHLEGPGCRAIEVSPWELLPTPEVYQRLRERMVTLVKRILVDNIPVFSRLKDEVNRQIPHEYTEEMNSKSNIVNLGVFSSPSSTTGVMDIMDSLHKLVPIVDGSPSPILCCGDGLSVERLILCKRSRNGGETPSDRLDGLIPTPQEFHKEILLLQDTWDEMFKSESEFSRGTIAHLKHKFGHTPLQKNVTENVQHSWDMMEFATLAYVTLMATTKLGMSTVDDVPEYFPKSIQMQRIWLRNTASDIVQFAWMPPDQKQINVVAASVGSATERKEECGCKEDKDEDMLQCSSSSCRNRWLHLSCAGLTEAPGGDWFCSEECQEDGTYIYCWCQANQGGEMVQCQLAEKCKKHEWYHIECLLPSDRPGEEDTWYCSEDCAASQPGAGEDAEDYLQNYSKALMWEGLSHLARRDAVREGDGPAMVDSWKMDLIRFWQRKHPKYLMNGHYMLTGIGGWLSEDLRNDLIWNRVANPTGKPGGNVGLDLINEFNNDFKDMMKNSHRRYRYTEKEVQRLAELDGSFGRDIDRILTNPGVESSSRCAKRQQADIQLFVKEFHADKLFSYVPNRSHTGLESFKYDTQIKHPLKLAKKMRMLSESLDDWDVFCTMYNPSV